MGDTRLERQLERFRVHIRKHEDGAVADIGRDAGDQPVTAEARRKATAFLDVVLRAWGREAGSHA